MKFGRRRFIGPHNFQYISADISISRKIKFFLQITLSRKGQLPEFCLWCNSVSFFVEMAFSVIFDKFDIKWDQEKYCKNIRTLIAINIKFLFLIIYFSYEGWRFKTSTSLPFLLFPKKLILKVMFLPAPVETKLKWKKNYRL